MANYANISAEIRAAIDTNNNQEITGAVLQAVLLDMVSNLGSGFQFAGVATPSTNPGTPDQKMFYIAGPGLYPNFNNAVVPVGYIGCFKYSGSWAIDTIVVGKDYDTQVADLWGEVFGTDNNYAAGYYLASGGVQSSATLWFHGVDYIPVREGDVITWNPGAVEGSASLVRYDSSKNVVGAWGANATERTLTVGSGVAYVRPSFAVDNFANAKITVNENTAWVPEDAIPGLISRVNTIEKTTTVGKSLFNVTVGTSHSSAADTMKVPISSGEKFYVYFVKPSAAAVSSASVFVRYAGASSNTNLGSMTPGEFKVFTAANDVEYVGIYVDAQNITTSGEVVFYATASNGLSDILYNALLILNTDDAAFKTAISGLQAAVNQIDALGVQAIDALGGNLKTLSISGNAVVLTYGVRLLTRGKMVLVRGDSPKTMAFDSTNAPNGGWFLSRDAVEAAASGDTISFDNITYRAVDNVNYRKDILLFATYYGRLIPAGIFGPLLLGLTDAATGVTVADMKSYAFNSVYNSVDVADKCKEFSALFNNSGVCESLVFMTDPHLLGQNNTLDESVFKTYIGLLQKYYNMLPVDWMICGGDWLNQNDYQATACWKLGYMDATMRKLFKHYYPLLGNHDTNYQGKISADDSSRGDLSHQTLVNLMFRENGNSYYEWRGNNTRFFVFDTQTDWESAMDSFKWEQIAWCANKLLTNTDAHIIFLQHIYTVSGNVAPMAEAIQTLAGAFNSRQSVTLNGVTYNFASAQGTVHCIISGHTHTDSIITTGNVPVWVTTNMQAGGTPTFDLMLIDYTAGTIKSVRVGTGVNRTMTLA